MESTKHRGLGVPAAPFANRPPSPPMINIPAASLSHASLEGMTLSPSYDAIDPSYLSASDLALITNDLAPQSVRDSSSNWTYNSRRQAQQVLDFLHLGPSSVARDRAWLADNGFTLLLACRDARLAQARLMAVDRVAGELGIEAAHVDVSGHQELIRAFPDAVRLINDHMLRLHYQGQGRRGKVLLFCETGNDRSASLAVAYLMAIYGADLVTACQYIQFSRFCVGLDEDSKLYLKNFGDILSARRTVNQHKSLSPAPLIAASDPSASALNDRKKSKRGYDDTVDMEDGEDMDTSADYDSDRYVGRAAWLPFVSGAE